MPSPHFSFSSLCLLILHVSSLVASTSSHNPDDHSPTKNGFRSTIRHVDSNKNLTKIEHLQRMVSRGKKRMTAIMLRATIARTTVIATDSDFVIDLSIGIPKPSPSYLSIDTGSSLTWTQCKPCKSCLNQSTPIFDPQTSSSYKPLNFSSNLCKALPSDSSSSGQHGECMYEYMYGDFSFTRGVLSIDTITFEKNASIPKLGFGCAFDTEGYSGTPGILGLGSGNLSLVSQTGAPEFSYCLPAYGSNQTGLLSLGGGPARRIPPHRKTTILIKNPNQPYYYYISLLGITIGGARLPIDPTKFAINEHGTGGMIIDSGTTYTSLERSAFDLVAKELTRQLRLPSFNGSEMGLFDLCFNITRCTIRRVVFPRFVFNFEWADYEVTRDNYFIDDVEKGIGCFTMGPSHYSSGFSIFGNFQQQNTLVIYDVVKEKLSFVTNTKCDNN